MEIPDALDFLRSNHRSVLITRKANGDPQPSPVVHGVDARDRVAISTRETAYKVRNLRRDPRAVLCALPDAFFGGFVVVEGDAEIVSLPQAMEDLVALYRQIAGEHPDWDDYRAAMERERRVVVVITPDRAGPDRRG